jgi:hypothetical protein
VIGNPEKGASQTLHLWQERRSAIDDEPSRLVSPFSSWDQASYAKFTGSAYCSYLAYSEFVLPVLESGGGYRVLFVAGMTERQWSSRMGESPAARPLRRQAARNTGRLADRPRSDCRTAARDSAVRCCPDPATCGCNAVSGRNQAVQSFYLEMGVSR